MKLGKEVFKDWHQWFNSLLVNSAFVCHHEEQWEGTCPYNVLTRTLMLTKLGTIRKIHNNVPTIIAGKQCTFHTTTKNNGKIRVHIHLAQ